MNNIKEYEKLKLEEQVLRNEYETKAYNLVKPYLDKIDEDWTDYLYNIYSLLNEVDAEKTSFEIDDYIFYFTDYYEIKVFRKKDVGFFKFINEHFFMIIYDDRKEEWCVSRYYNFSPEIDIVNELISKMKPFLDKTDLLKELLDKEIEQQVIEVNKKRKSIIEMIKEKLKNL